MGTYKPRRAGARWLEDAPEYILDVWDNGGRTCDRYTVFFGGSLAMPGRGPGDTRVQYLGLSDNPESPQGFSMWGDMGAYERSGFTYARRGGNRRIRWLDLPEHVRDHIRARAGFAIGDLASSERIEAAARYDYFEPQFHLLTDSQEVRSAIKEGAPKCKRRLPRNIASLLAVRSPDGNLLQLWASGRTIPLVDTQWERVA